MFKKGQKVKVKRDNDNETYDSFRDKILIVSGVFKNDKDHPGYDMGLFPERLYEFVDEEGNDIPFALYEYELEKIK